MCLGSVSAVRRFFLSCGTGSVQPRPHKTQQLHDNSSIRFLRVKDQFQRYLKASIMAGSARPAPGGHFKNLKPLEEEDGP